jgi:hypothetical protein
MGIAHRYELIVAFPPHMQTKVTRLTRLPRVTARSVLFRLRHNSARGPEDGSFSCLVEEALLSANQSSPEKLRAELTGRLSTGTRESAAELRVKCGVFAGGHDSFVDREGLACSERLKSR